MYVMVTYFVTGILPINGISFKSHELEEEIILTNHVSPYITLLVINSLGDEHSYSSIPMSFMKVLSINQTHAGLLLVRAWFKTEFATKNHFHFLLLYDMFIVS